MRRWSRTEITARLNELKPLVDEYQRLDAAAAALDGLPPSLHAAPATRRAPTHTTTVPARKRSTTHNGGRRGWPKGSGTRGAEALALVKENPGLPVPEIAEKMGIKQNYRVSSRFGGEGWRACPPPSSPGWPPKRP